MKKKKKKRKRKREKEKKKKKKKKKKRNRKKKNRRNPYITRIHALAVLFQTEFFFFLKLERWMTRIFER